VLWSEKAEYFGVTEPGSTWAYLMLSHNILFSISWIWRFWYLESPASG